MTQLNTGCEPSLVCPCAAHIPHRIAATPKQKQGLIERLDEFDAVCVS